MLYLAAAYVTGLTGDYRREFSNDPGVVTGHSVRHDYARVHAFSVRVTCDVMALNGNTTAVT